MKKIPFNLKSFAIMLLVGCIVIFGFCSSRKNHAKIEPAQSNSLLNKINKSSKGNAMVAKEPSFFDAMDLTVFFYQDWICLSEMPAHNS